MCTGYSPYKGVYYIYILHVLLYMYCCMTSSHTCLNYSGSPLSDYTRQAIINPLQIPPLIRDLFRMLV